MKTFHHHSLKGMQDAGAIVFNTSLTNGQEAEGVTYTEKTGTVFWFNSPQPNDMPFPASMQVFRNGAAIGLIDFNAGSLGQPCGVEIEGILYYTTFQNSLSVALN